MIAATAGEAVQVDSSPISGRSEVRTNTDQNQNGSLISISVLSVYAAHYEPW